MKPKMPDFVTVMTPTGEIDRFGRNITTNVVSAARVTPLIRTIETTEGNKVDTAAEIDLPPEVVVGNGTKIKFTDQLGRVLETRVLRLDFTPDLANHVLFWTVQVG